MRRAFFLSATVVAALLNAPALAADMPLKAPQGMAALYDWTGFYVGIHGGHAWGNGTSENITDSISFPAGFISDRHSNGPFAGGQIGANYQFGQWVLGVEADLAASGIEGHEVVESPVTTGTLADGVGRWPWIGTVTGRLGYAMNNVLFYGKGGGVWAGHEVSVFTTNAAGNVTTRSSESETHSGWTAGGGIEIGLHPNISIKAEYDHYDFGSSTIQRSIFFSTVGAIPVGTVNLQKAQDKMDLFKVGLNYRFTAR